MALAEAVGADGAGGRDTETGTDRKASGSNRWEAS